MPGRLATCAVLSIALLASTTGYAQPRSRGAQPRCAIPAFDSAALSQLNAGVPGIVIAVRKGPWCAAEGAWGQVNEGGVHATQVDSTFQIGSITKQFTAAAIMRLAEEGRLTIREDVRRYIPELDTHGYIVRIENLLRHTSGLPGIGDYPYNQELSIETAISLMNARPFRFQPGISWEYSNSGYYLLGVIIERVSGMSYADYMQQTFILPLGLVHTAYCGRSPAAPIPSGYHKGAAANSETIAVPSVDMSNPYSAGALCSTAGDLVRWMGMLRTGQAVSSASYQQMISPTILTSGVEVRYGFGLFLEMWAGTASVEHGGQTLGFQTFLTYVPAYDLTIAVMLNRSHEGTFDAAVLGQHVATFFLGQ